MPPSFLRRAHKLAPYKISMMPSSTLPESIRFTKAVSSFKRASPACPALEQTRSFRCCGVKPSRPPADPLRKEQMAARTSLAVTIRCSLSVAGGSGKERSS
ncbi:unnamed protein product [Arctia plantaginis]|uniref:Uncharacterized protein n=1 Tax=Arctia plantaginis TaxID=874455 RepID=A0A8S0ZPJ9_ARCPL|nr:unnamed protein product [Arctia plantaginis]